MPESRSYLGGLTGLLLLAVVAAGCKKKEDPAEFEKLSFNAGEVLAKLPAGLTGSTTFQPLSALVIWSLQWTCPLL
jgi:hypothetical protein